MSSVMDYIGNNILGTGNRAQVNAAQDMLDSIGVMANDVSQQNRGIYDRYKGEMDSMYGGANQQYSDAVNRLAEAIGNYGDFQYNGNVNDFMDPAANLRVDRAMNAMNRSASSGGSRFSSQYQDAMTAKQQALASEEWRSAWDRMQQDRQNQLQQWQTGQNKINNLGTLANIYGQDRNQYADALGNYYSAQANQNNANLETYADIASGKANLESQKTNGVGSFLGGAAKVAGALFG